MAQVRRLCNIVLILVVSFVHADVLYVCTADTTRVFCLRTNLGLALYYFMFIFCFWALYAVEPTFVMPKEWARLVPAFHNHVTHTAPVAFLLIDTLLTCHHAPGRATGSLVVLGCFSIYLAIIFGVRFLEGYWLYPIFDKLQKQQIALLLAVAGALFWFLYLIGDGLNTMLWGKAPHAPQNPQKVAQKQQ